MTENARLALRQTVIDGSRKLDYFLTVTLGAIITYIAEGVENLDDNIEDTFLVVGLVLLTLGFFASILRIEAFELANVANHKGYEASETDFDDGHFREEFDRIRKKSASYYRARKWLLIIGFGLYLVGRLMNAA